MAITAYPIMGVQFGFEFTSNEVDGNELDYLLIDIFIIRVQIAWYK